jgi:disulfide oxidoreductase YuzD
MRGIDFVTNLKIEIILYGSDELCPSCVHLPSSKETFEWLEAAISRRFPNQPFKMSYVDIQQPPEETGKAEFAKRVIEEDMFYPVVVINEKIVGEGNPRLKTIFAELEKYGYKAM